MHRRRSLPLPALPGLAVLAACLVAAPVALAKDGEARLDAPISPDAAPGSTVTVGWLALASDGATDHPMYGSPLFIRLISPTGEAVEQGGTEDPPGSGHYLATLAVPAGGIARFEIGLRGEACTAGVCERSDWLLRISDRPSGYGPPVAATGAGAAGGPVPASPDPQGGHAATTSATRSDGSLAAPFLLLVLALGATVLGSIAIRRRRTEPVRP